ncbi:MAG TPA: DUF5916 domain-containing protein [Vicinamibacterales bacterium]|nr:DUF5916 domain-containing protein [Vicinamibacterales bacterium]
MIRIPIAAAVVILVALSAYAQQAPFNVKRATQPPTIDGVLDDVTWQQIEPMPTGQWKSYNPSRGDLMPDVYRTDVRVAYDDRNIYFAFHCRDNEPEKIRTNVAKRDSAFNDDWLAMSLDSAGTGQSAYHLFTNPSGSQMDALNTSASGEQFDADMVWYSAAQTTSDGYTVEVQIPLQTLRFKGGDAVRMGLVFFRKVSRIGVSYAWPEMLPGQWVFDRPAHIIFSNLQPRRLVEVLPSVTYNISQVRADEARWNSADDKYNFGASGKFGITSGITLDGTINPDFSQVESDAFQVEVNQRFPVFYSEKRPFFMEGMGLFNIAGAGGGDGNMRTAVHTRRIVDPIFGSKLTGTLGKTTFGVLNALDDKPPVLASFDSAGRPLPTPNRSFTVGRATYALRRSDYVGGIFTHTHLDGRHNMVVGGDISIRPSSSQSVSATLLASQSTGNVPQDLSGTSAQATYGYNTRTINFVLQGEHYDRDFEMDTAFYNRTGFTAAWTYGEYSFYPKSGTNFWLQRVFPFFFGKAGRDRVQDGNEDFIHTGIRFNTTRQGFISVGYMNGHETWRGQRFRLAHTVNAFGFLQPFRWLGVFARYSGGYAIFYDFNNPFQGRQPSAGLGLNFQPNQHVTQGIDFNTVRFNRASTGERIYSVNIINSKTTYQFDKHFLVRFLAQYDSSAKRVLTDLLASYEFVPGTVAHAGYGSLYEDSAEFLNRPPLASDKYLMVNRGLFLKASYLWRF